MARSKHAEILALFLGAGLLAACAGDGANSNATNAARPATSVRTEEMNSTRTNVEELGMLIKVPFEAEDIVWRDYTAKKRIVAVIRFSPADANRIVSEAGGTPEGAEVAVESWFPDELVAQGEMSGDRALRGTVYPATAFYQEPYTKGKAIRIEGTDYFIIEISAE